MAIKSKMEIRAEAFLNRTSRFLNTGTILLIDIFVSILSSALVLLGSYLVAPLFFSAELAIKYLVVTALTSLLAFYIFKTHKIIIRHTTVKDLLRLFASILLQELMMCGVIATFGYLVPFIIALLFVDLFVTVVALIAVRAVMIMVYDLLRSHIKANRTIDNVLVFGISAESVSAMQAIAGSISYRPVGFLAPQASTKSCVISEHPVFHYKTNEELDTIVGKRTVGAILFPDEASVRANSDLIKYAKANSLKTLIVPSVAAIDRKVKRLGTVREIKIEDLLGRPEIEISMGEIRKFLNGKTVLVTGAAGSIGSELVRQISKMGVGRIVLFDNAETPMHNLRLELDDNFPELKYFPVIGDVRHEERLDYAFRTFHPQIVFHAAAYKHVPLMEENPCEAVLVNVKGTRNVARKCLEYGVEEMVMISTDKAVNPTNVMGCSKRIAEIYVQSLGLAIAEGKQTGSTRFVTTRFGNVLGSNGSVIPRFRKQIASGGPVTVTHPEINRFFMTIPEACRLVMEAATMRDENAIYAFDMGSPVKIDTLARRMIELAGYKPDVDIKVKYTGLRPGEKLYEEVLADTENSYPTSHDRIRIAKVRSYPFEEASRLSDKLIETSMAVDLKSTLQFMKQAVPEFSCSNEYLK